MISLAVEDFDGDGKDDLAAGTRAESSVAGVTVLLGVGDGTGRPTGPNSLGSNVISLAVGDFDGDGKDDLAAGTSVGVAVLLNAGNGTLKPPAAPLAGPVNVLAVGDFDGDGKDDLAAGTGVGVAVLKNVGGGSLKPSRHLFDGFQRRLPGGGGF